MAMERCAWAKNDRMIAYHDQEWGVPVYGDSQHFEFLTLEAAQAGLNWDIVLSKRPAYRQAFAQFDPVEVAHFDTAVIERLMQNAGIIRNRAKITAAIDNAKAFIAIQQEFSSFNQYVWRFVNGTPIVNQWRSMEEVPSISPEAQALSNDLKKRGFKFVGPTICYAYLQATGLVNDHLLSCAYRKIPSNKI